MNVAAWLRARKLFEQTCVESDFVQGPPEGRVVDVGASDGAQLSLKNFQINLSKFQNVGERADVVQAVGVEEREQHKELEEVLVGHHSRNFCHHVKETSDVWLVQSAVIDFRLVEVRPLEEVEVEAAELILPRVVGRIEEAEDDLELAFTGLDAVHLSAAQPHGRLVVFAPKRLLERKIYSTDFNISFAETNIQSW